MAWFATRPKPAPQFVAPKEVTDIISIQERTRMALKTRTSADTEKFVLTIPKVTVKFSKKTGGAYADTSEIIQSELAHIRQQSADSKPETPDNSNDATK